MADIKYLRSLVNGIPTTLDLTASGNVLQSADFQLVNAGITASKPMKLDADKKMVSGDIDLTAEVTGALPYANMNIADADLTIAKTSGLQSAIDGKIASTEKGAVSGVCELDVNQLVPITRMPPAALERLVIVADETARFALTTATVQNGDTVKQTDNNLMYFVKDDTNLDSALGYEQYTAGGASSVPWSGVTGTPTTVAGYGITDVGDVAKAACVADSITDAVTDVAPSQNAVFDALALKSDTTHNHDGTYEPENANIQSHISTVAGNPHAVTKSEVGLANVDNVQQMPLSYLDTDANLAADSDAKVPSQKAVKAYIDTIGQEQVDFAGIMGEALLANKTYVVRKAISGESAGKLYICTSDEQNAPGEHLAVGIVQTVGAVAIDDEVTVIKFKKELTLASADSVIGASSADNGKAIYLNKDGAFSLVPGAGITTGESYASRQIGVLENYDATVTNQKILVDICVSAWFGFDLGA